MQKFPVVLDLETKHTFREFDDHKKLGISVVAVYNYADQKGQVFTEKELNQLYPILENASYIVGYNIRSFDLPVLQAYYPGNIEVFALFDILDDIKEKIGRRIGLNDVAYATLNEKKTGHGLMAIDYYKEGKWDELKKYCMDDVMVTKKLFDYGLEKGEIFYMNEIGKISIKVDWKKYREGNGGGNDMPLTLPF
ncbi:MAG TPA: ribonuclease H-like domain-containing protein [Candidatus Woesebacteria bacterium]|nr:ribonuclease H-like domain-containing protein [Candidatus Woesebacteria bacterium]